MKLFKLTKTGINSLPENFFSFALTPCLGRTIAPVPQATWFAAGFKDQTGLVDIHTNI